MQDVVFAKDDFLVLDTDLVQDKNHGQLNFVVLLYLQPQSVALNLVDLFQIEQLVAQERMAMSQIGPSSYRSTTCSCLLPPFNGFLFLRSDRRCYTACESSELTWRSSRHA